MKSDYLFQSEFVINNAWRILSFQDKDLSSPSYGNFHYSYWRDKTSEFADSRFQEAGATMGILSSKDYTQYHENLLPSKNILYRSFSAGLENLSRLQYDNGCFDEWYKGERGFAATEFTTIAYGLAAIFLKDELENSDHNRLVLVLTKAGEWLSKREDKIKSNHQAASAAALALIWKITGKEYFLNKSKEAIDKTINRQTNEGWFPEIGGMDLGYCGVLLDYCMIFFWITNDDRGIKPMKKLIKFMLPHIHPDGTVSGESGICANPYASRLGLSLLANHSKEALWLLKGTEKKYFSKNVLEPYLADDLRFCRWSHLPLVANRFYKSFDYETVKLTKDYYPAGWTIKKSSSLVAYHSKNIHIYISVAGGGVIRIFNNSDLIFEEKGLLLKKKNCIWNTRGYRIPRKILHNNNILSFEGDLHKARYSFPGFLSRTILRILCINPYLSKNIRRIIDEYRLKNGSALNQSAGSISRGNKIIKFQKKVTIEMNNIIIKYEIKPNEFLKISDCFIIDYFAPNHIFEIEKKDSTINIIFKIKLNEIKKLKQYRYIKKMHDFIS